MPTPSRDATVRWLLPVVCLLFFPGSFDDILRP